MNDSQLRELLAEVADAVKPGDRLADIQARTRPSRSRFWAVPAGAALVAASVVGAVALSGAPAQRSAEPGPAGGTSAPPSATEPSPTDQTPSAPAPTAVAVYYVGGTPDGPRLYREFRRPAADPLTAAIDALAQAPEDPDYENLWPAGAIESVSFDGVGADGVIQVRLTDAAYRHLPFELTEAEAALAVEQVVRTLQAAVQARAAVQFVLDGNPIDQVLGVPASEPVSPGTDLEVLAHVSLSSPSEGQVVDNVEMLVVSGAGTSYGGYIVVELQRPDGSTVLDPVRTFAGSDTKRLFPFDAGLDISYLPAGEYVVRAQTPGRDPSGNQRFHIDTRTITIVD